MRTVDPNLKNSLVYNHKIQRNGSLATGISILVMTIEEDLGSNEEGLYITCHLKAAALGKS